MIMLSVAAQGRPKIQNRCPSLLNFACHILHVDPSPIHKGCDSASEDGKNDNCHNQLGSGPSARENKSK